LYSDAEETFFDSKRPVLLAGIEDVVSRGDLADRCLHIILPPIPEDKRVTEGSLWTEFELAAPLIFGAILDAVSRGLVLLPTINLARLPRMADFCRWGEAVCRASGFKQDEFMDAYAGNREHASQSILDDSPVPAALEKLVVWGNRWEGTSSELLDALAQHVNEKVRESKTWPKGPRAMAGILRRLAPSLRVVGIDVTFSREGHARARTIAVERAGIRPSAPSAPSAVAAGSHEPADGMRTQTVPADANADGRFSPSSASNPAKHGVVDDADHADANTPSLSGGGDREVVEL
jgi:hypothetical protein